MSLKTENSRRVAKSRPKIWPQNRKIIKTHSQLGLKIECYKKDIYIAKR
jgi:hypothetical protein